MKICLVRLSALGDIVMMLPLIRTLQTNFPKAEITWVIDRHLSQIVEKLEGINFIRIKKVRSLKDFIRVKRLLSDLSFDFLLATQASMSAHLLYPLIRAKEKIGYDAKRSKDFHSLFVHRRIPFVKEHTVEGFLSFAKEIGADNLSLDGTIPLDASDRSWAKKIMGRDKFYVINPCSSKAGKDWPLERFKEVALELGKLKYRVVLTGALTDRPVCEKLAKMVGDNVVNLSGKTTLRQLAAIVEGAQFVISPDTGPAHIAASMGTSVIGLFAATRSELTGPYFSKNYLIDKHEEALRLYKNSKEPELEWNSRVYHEDAMKLIEVNEVLEKVDHCIREDK